MYFMDMELVGSKYIPDGTRTELTYGNFSEEQLRHVYKQAKVHGISDDPDFDDGILTATTATLLLCRYKHYNSTGTPWDGSAVIPMTAESLAPWDRAIWKGSI
ncbi:hypothetical protein KAH94_06690 [bacterium]|nr:hypothetical protein [bacterium]